MVDLAGSEEKVPIFDDEPRVVSSPTAADLANFTHKRECAFCSQQHDSTSCLRALGMSLDEKRNLLAKGHFCFACTKSGHSYRRCRAKCDSCGGRHIKLMCNKPLGAPGETSLTKGLGITLQETTRNEVDLLSINHSLTVSSASEVFLQTFSVLLRNGEKERRSRVLVDTGSQRSYVRTEVAEEMGYESFGEESLIHSLFGGGSLGVVKHKKYKVRLLSLDQKFACNFCVLDHKNIAAYIPTVVVGPALQRELDIANVQLVSDLYGPIDVLIGADVAGKILSSGRKVLPCGMVALETCFGWSIMGSCKEPVVPVTPCSSNLAITYTMLTVTASDVCDLWKLESIGIQDPAEHVDRESKRLATLRHFKETVEFVNGRYQVRLPWRDKVNELPSNRALAAGRLDRVIRKMQRSGSLLQEYDSIFREWLHLNVIERAKDDSSGHYLPHHPVVKESSCTTKVRPVFDASAKIAGSPSLNDCLDEGPNLIELLPDVLLRFREKAIGVSADIEKAFLQISMHPEDRAFLKFLWWDDERDHLVALQHTRVVFGVTCSPFLLGAVLEHHIERSAVSTCPEYAAWLSNIARNFYVDNLAMSVNDKEEAAQLCHIATNVMADGGFNLRGWEFTGDRECEGAISPILGLKWNRQSDTLSLNMDWWEKYTKTDVLTKRSVLSMAQRIFDPVGFATPVVLHLKLLIQSLWEKKVDWDEPLDAGDHKSFEIWLNSVHLLKKIEIPRNIGTNINQSIHLFTDAINKSYAACIFLRSVNEAGDALVSLVRAKSRVAPLKGLTMPRLELLGVTIGARLLKATMEALGWIDIPVFAWCDSSTVLTWIQKQEEWSVFVRNRVKEIRELTPNVRWRHIPGHLNPADLLSRGCSVEQLIHSQWWNGPAWLVDREEDWPVSPCTYCEEEVGSERTKKASTLLDGVEDQSWIHEYFSKYEKIVRMIGWVQRFVYNCRHHLRKRRGNLSAWELVEAEHIVLRHVQSESFSSLTDPRLSDLRPFIDDHGLIRVKTKISERDDEMGFKTPIVLPSSHPVVDRLIWDLHYKCHHVGAQTLLSLLRERFWVLKGRQTTRRIVGKCVICKRFSSKPFDIESPPLPETRVRNTRVFEVTGLDYAGPLYLRDGVKVWVCLFTCANFRAVPLEIVPSLSTESFILALRRFIARRGRPAIIYSDNGPNFHGANNVFAELDWEKIATYCSCERIDWKFSPPAAPWWGGFWERLVGVLKSLLKRTLGRAALNLDELYTLICDCEAQINSRPLTQISESINDPLPLTPAMFLQDLQQIDVPDCDEYEKTNLQEHLRYRQKLRDFFRERFRSEYLGQLKWTSRKSTLQPTEGEVVLIEAENSKRLEWTLAVIEKVKSGSDGKIRVLELKTPFGRITRPIQRVYPLELSISGPNHGGALLESDGSSPEADHPTTDSDVNEETFPIADPEPATLEEGLVSQEVKMSRVGRKIVPPQKLNL